MKDARPSIPGIELGPLRRSAGRLESHDATDRSSGRPVVVSFIAPGDDDYLELVVAQQRRLQALTTSSGIDGAVHLQKVLDTGIDRDGNGYVVSEVVEGRRLDDVAQGGSIERLGAIADALRVLHDRDLAHGALAPENIVVRDDGTIVLLNAGLAGYVDESASIFQPDEQSLRPQPVVADDVFSLGALGWWLQTGRTPDKPGALGAPDHVEAALRRALDLDATNRQWTVREFLYELEYAVDENRSFVPVDHGGPALPPAGLGPRPLPILVGVVGAIALLFGAFSVFGPSDGDIDTEVLGVTTVPLTTSTTVPTTATTGVTTSSPSTMITGDTAGSTDTDTSLTTSAPAPTPTTRPPATNRPTTTRPTTAPTTAPTITVTPLPPTSQVPIPSVSTTAVTILRPTTTTTRPTTTTTTTRPTTTTDAPTTTEPPTTESPTTAPTTEPPTVDNVTRNPVLPDTPVTGNRRPKDE